MAGVSLLELLIVLTILALASAIVIPMLSGV
jgi:prepilin-type N-terminal cleavage/methylation domain-containing protein